MANRKSFVDKLISSQQRKVKRGLRKAVTGSGDSLKVQAKRRLRKAVTGSSQSLGTQAKRRLRKAVVGSSQPERSAGSSAKRAGCLSRGALPMLVAVLVLLMLAGCGGAEPAQLTPQDVIDAFVAAGLEAESPVAMTKDDYGLAPLRDQGALRFLIPSLCADCGGRVFTFDKPEDLAAVKAYYDELGKASAAIFSWTFARDNILVQINGALPEAQARAYEAALLAAEAK